jgi:rSAM/selenodomain-associated transferase 1
MQSSSQADARSEGARAARRTAVFAKQPRAGQVKTRLCPPLDPLEAALLAEAMLEDTLRRCSGCSEWESVLYFAPSQAAAWFRWRFPRIADQRAQRGADLAERMANFFEDECAPAGTLGQSRVLIGSDAPLVPASRITRAHELLEQGTDLVLGPDAGGGYYLVGLRHACRELFLRVGMSAGDMCAATLELARARGLSCATLESAQDVDRPADLERLRLGLLQAEPAAQRAADWPACTADLLSAWDDARADR